MGSLNDHEGRLVADGNFHDATASELVIIRGLLENLRGDDALMLVGEWVTGSGLHRLGHSSGVQWLISYMRAKQ